MAQAQLTHANHYVPQFYLKNWSKDGISIYVYSLLVSDSRVKYWHEGKIRSTAVWNDFYTRKEGEREIDDFEKWFNEEFETPVKSVFEKLLSGIQPNKEEADHITRFVIAQYMRTPAQYEEITKNWLRDTPHNMEKTTRSVSNLVQTYPQKIRRRERMPDYFNLIPMTISRNPDTCQLRVETIKGKGTYLFALKHVLTKTIRKLEKYQWHVINAAANISFPTSDNPVICMNVRTEYDYDFLGGWGVKNGTILMPLSPNKLLFAQVGSKIFPKEKLDYSEYWSAFFRKIIIEHAHRYVYAIAPQKGMTAIKVRRVSADLYEREKSMMAGWHDEQMEAEAQLLKRDLSN